MTYDYGKPIWTNGKKTELERVLEEGRFAPPSVKSALARNSNAAADERQINNKTE